MAQAATRRSSQLLDFQLIAVGLIAAAGLATEPLTYLCVVVPALLPLYVWLRAGAPGLPTLPLTGALSIIYYAVPVLRGRLFDVTPSEVLYAATSVGSFLVSATIAYWLIMGPARRRQLQGNLLGISEPGIVQLAFVGMTLGIAFYVAIFAHWLDWLGTFGGVVRAVALTFGSIGCYLVGSARARGLLHGERWAAALLCLNLIIALSINGLLLISGAINLLAATLGYVVSARRIPWVTLGILFGVISIFQAGKAEIRAEHVDESAELSLVELPETIVEWFVDGVEVLWTGAQQIDALERASLLWVLIGVQDNTPDHVPYMNGETYKLLPQIILPRFIEPDKVRSQAGLNLLAMHYGMQAPDATDRTTIGFGLVAEAYANFGFVGVLVVGGVFGALCGAITWLGSGGSPVSMRMLVSIAATSVLLNLEADFSYLIVTMAQAVGGVLLIATATPVLKALFPAPAQLRMSGPARQVAGAREPAGERRLGPAK